MGGVCSKNDKRGKEESDEVSLVTDLWFKLTVVVAHWREYSSESTGESAASINAKSRGKTDGNPANRRLDTLNSRRGHFFDGRPDLVRPDRSLPMDGPSGTRAILSI